MLLLLTKLLRAFIHVGTLEILLKDGRLVSIEGPMKGHHIRLGLTNIYGLWSLVLRPDLKLGELYMKGDLTLIKGDLRGLLAFAVANKGHWEASKFGRITLILARMRSRFSFGNHLRVAARNVRHHYDLGVDLYRLFLDGWRQYSCGYFEDEDDLLDTAQQRKIARIAAKLCLDDQHRLLDIGCGWGGLATALSQLGPKIHVTGITLSENQLGYAQKQTKLQGMTDRLDFQLMDYRKMSGQFDRIVSVGMLEHVGPTHFSPYFRQIERLLKPDGIALIHAIGTNHRTSHCNAWINKYIFPGGYLPDLSEMTEHVMQAGLTLTDIDIWHQHYAYTLNAWHERFLAASDRLPDRYDAEFQRMWRFYLSGCEQLFRQGHIMVFQLQITKDPLSVPLCRSYIGEKQKAYEQTLWQIPPFGRRPRLKR